MLRGRPRGALGECGNLLPGHPSDTGRGLASCAPWGFQVLPSHLRCPRGRCCPLCARPARPRRLCSAVTSSPPAPGGASAAPGASGAPACLLPQRLRPALVHGRPEHAAASALGAVPCAPARLQAETSCSQDRKRAAAGTQRSPPVTCSCHALCASSPSAAPCHGALRCGVCTRDAAVGFVVAGGAFTNTAQEEICKVGPALFLGLDPQDHRAEPACCMPGSPLGKNRGSLCHGVRPSRVRQPPPDTLTDRRHAGQLSQPPVSATGRAARGGPGVEPPLTGGS